MGPGRHDLAGQTWAELRDRRPLVLLPVGSIEQHGPHLPLDTDAAVATAVATRAVERLAATVDVALAPVLPYGASGEHEAFPGTVSIGHEALRLLLIEIGRSALRWSGRLVIVNGHGGNLATVQDAVLRLRYEQRDVAWWACATPGGDAHAGRTETSLMYALRPAAVRAELAVAGPTEPVEQLMSQLVAHGVGGVSASGVLGDPTGADAEEGNALLDDLTDRLCAAVLGWHVDGRGSLAATADRVAEPRP